MIPFLEKNKSIILTTLLIFLILFIKGLNIKQDIGTSEVISHVSSSQVEPENNSIFVEVWGGVTYPGVYEITDNSLVIDLINLAGGLTDNADLIYAEKYIPFSKRLVPEMKIFIPIFNLGLSDLNQDLIYLNYAEKETIMSIKGIGDVTAEKIVSHRPFSSWEDLMEKTGIRSDLIEILKNNAII